MDWLLHRGLRLACGTLGGHLAQGLRVRPHLGEEPGDKEACINVGVAVGLLRGKRLGGEKTAGCLLRVSTDGRARGNTRGGECGDDGGKNIHTFNPSGRPTAVHSNASARRTRNPQK